MTMIDLSGVTYVVPIISFVLVFVLLFAILKKTEVLGDNAAIQVIISLAVAVLFISFTNVRSFVEEITPWFVVILMLAFFLLIFVMFIVAKDPEKVLKPGVAWVILAVLGVIVIFIWFNHFSVGHTHAWHDFKHWLFNKQVYSTIWIAIVAFVVGWVLVKAK